MKDYTATNPDVSFDTSANQDNIIHSDAKTELIYLWFFSFCWNAFVFGFIFLGQDELLKTVDDSPILYVFIIFPLVGFAFLYSAIKGTIAWFSFGETPLVLSVFPAKLGEEITGYIDIDTEYSLAKKAIISLSCHHHFLEKSEGETEQRMEVVWQDDISVSTQATLKGSRLCFSFHPPSDLSETQKKSKDYHEWVIHVELPLIGSDFERKYTVPIAKADKDRIQASSNPNPVSKSLYKTQQDSVNLKEEPAKAIPDISTSLSGKLFHYPASRHRVFAIGFIMVALFIGFFLYYMYQEFADFLPLSSLYIFSLAAIAPIGFFCFGLLALGYTLTVEASLKGFEITHRLLFYQHKGMLEASRIVDIKIEKSGSASINGHSSRVWYSLQAVEKDGAESTIGDNLEGYRYAKSVRQQLIDALGSRWKPSKVSESVKPKPKSRIDKIEPVARIFSKIVPFIGLVLLAYDLRDFIFRIMG